MNPLRGPLSRLQGAVERHVWLRFLLLLSLFALPSLLGLQKLYQFDEKDERNKIEQREREHLLFQRTILWGNFLKVTDHLRELSYDSRILDYLARPGEADARRDAEAAILRLCQFRNIYKRITLIDASGNALLRVWDFKGKEPFLADDPKLLRFTVSEREAFDETLRLATGEIFLRDFDLNLADYGLGTETVHLLRFGLKLKGPSGEPLGAIFLNYEFEDIVNDVNLALPVTMSGFSIVDERGRILNRGRIYELEPSPGSGGRATSVHDPESFPEIYPGFWSMLATGVRPEPPVDWFGLWNPWGRDTRPISEKQAFIPREGIFTWERLFPFRALRLLEKETAFELDEFLKGDQSTHHWILISRIDRERFEEIFRPLRERYLKFALGLFTVLLVICGALAVFQHRRLESLNELRRTLDLLDRELDMSRTVLESLMPKGFADLPELDADHAYLPSSKVGGDFFDLFRLSERKIGFFLFDMSGHGVPAALGTLLVRACFVRFLRETQSPSATLAAANDELQDQLGEDHFLTAFAGVIDLESRVLTFASAGSPPPFRLRAGALPEPLEADGSLLGVLPGVSFHEERRDLAPGDRIVLYTDGLVEARDPDRRMYSAGRLAALLAGSLPPDAKGLRDLVVDDLRAFTKCEERFVDDVTLLVIRVL